MQLTAHPTGFAMPSYEWFLVPADGAAPIQIAAGPTTIDWSTHVVDPANPIPTTALSQPLPVDIDAGIPTTIPFGDTQAPLGLLTLDVSGGQGDVLAVIECRATDGVTPATTTATSLVTLRCRHVIEADSETLRDCRQRAADLVAHSRIPPILHPIAPDPPPELLLAIFILRELGAVAQQATEKDDKRTLALLSSVMNDALQLPSAVLAPIEQVHEPAE